jgi:hypothetical protein
MKPYRILLTLCSAASLCLSTAIAADSPVTVAVLPFEVSGTDLKDRATEASALLAAQLSANPNLWMVEREEIDKLLSEHTIKLSGLTDPAQSVQAGRMLGARALVTGRLILAGSNIVMVAKIMSTDSSRVFGETATNPAAASLEKSAAELSGKIGKLLEKQAAIFQPSLEKRDERLARLKKLLEGKQLPSVQIQVPEQELRGATPDPAVETELGNGLKELGFEVVTTREGGKQADITISGSAFSEAGVRRGQLVSARARIELKVTRRADDKVLAIDRETSVAVDTAPAVAGKSALQEGAMNLLERVVPKLVAP